MVNKLYIYILLLVLAVPCGIHAAGTNSAEFLTLGVGARPTALGEAFSAASDDPSLIHYNPAALATVYSTKLSLTHNEFIENVHYSNMNFTYPLDTGSHITLGLGLYHMAIRNIPEYNYLGERVNDISVNNSMAVFTYSQAVLPSLMLGANIKFMQERLYTYREHLFLADIGFWHPTFVPWLSIGGSIQNIGPAVKYTKESFPLPRTQRLGASYNLPWLDRSLLLLAETTKTNEEKSRYSFGLEANTIKAISLRAGFNSRKREGSKTTFGIGINLRKLKIDYSIAPYGKLGDSHIVSVEYLIDALQKSRRTQLSEEESELHFMRAQTRSIENDDIGALKLLKQAKRAYPGNQKVDDLQKKLTGGLYENALDIYENEGRIDEAIDILKNIRKHYKHKDSKKLLKKLLKEKKK